MKNINNKCYVPHRFKVGRMHCLDTWLLGACIVLLVIGVIAGVCWVLVKMHTGFVGLDVAIRVALLSFCGSSIGVLLSKKYDLKCRLHEQLIINRRATYEEIVSFLFECQQREGYDVALSSIEVEQRCSKVTQKVLLWASEPIQIGWHKYLCFRHNGKGGQLIIGTILYDIGREMGYKYNNAFFAYHRPLEFFYGCNSVTISLDKNNEKI